VPVSLRRNLELGIEVTNFGCHDSLAEVESNQRGLARDIVDRFGTHPMRCEIPVDKGARELRRIRDDLVAGARLVKAGNTLGADVLGSDPHEAGGQRVIFISGDDADAKAKVVALFQDAGFAAIDVGDLPTGGAMQQIHHPLAGVNLIRL